MAIQLITYENKTDLTTSAVADKNKVKASDMNEIKSAINNNANMLATLDSSVKGTANYLKLGSYYVCWGQAHPTYANANVMTSSTALPVSFTNGRAIATTVNYNNQSFELDAIAKVPSAVNGTSLNMALHSKSGAFTSSSTDFYINYVVIGEGTV